jgi:hypothetical protein
MIVDTAGVSSEDLFETLQNERRYEEDDPPLFSPDQASAPSLSSPFNRIKMRVLRPLTDVRIPIGPLREEAADKEERRRMASFATCSTKYA